jgi:hypothetical protein
MKVLGVVLRLIRLALLAIFLFYWAAMICISIERLIEGGPDAVVHYYRYLFYYYQDSRPAGLNSTSFWIPFLEVQCVYLAVTLAIWLIGRRRPNRDSARTKLP